MMYHLLAYTRGSTIRIHLHRSNCINDCRPSSFDLAVLQIYIDSCRQTLRETYEIDCNGANLEGTVERPYIIESPNTSVDEIRETIEIWKSWNQICCHPWQANANCCLRKYKCIGCLLFTHLKPRGCHKTSSDKHDSGYERPAWKYKKCEIHDGSLKRESPKLSRELV